MYPIVKRIALGFFLTWATGGTAHAVEGVDVMHRFLDGLESLDARFMQTVHTDNGVLGPMSGHLYVARPGRFRWDYDGDEGQLIVADGKRVWLLDRKLEQVSHQSQDRALRGTPALLLVSGDAVEDYFTPVDGGELDGMMWVEMVPKDEESQFNLVRVAFDGDQLARIEMLDKFGQFTEFVLSDVQRNAKVDDDLFDFKPPPGWDVFQTH